MINFALSTRPGISRFSDVQLHIVIRCFVSRSRCPLSRVEPTCHSGPSHFCFWTHCGHVQHVQLIDVRPAVSCSYFRGSRTGALEKSAAQYLQGLPTTTFGMY